MHTIRLRGPWEVEPLRRFVRDGAEFLSRADSAPRVRQTMPADWAESVGRDFLGVVRYQRNFNWPAPLLPEERVWLVVEPPRSVGKVRLNGAELGAVGEGAVGRFDITAMCGLSNWLEIEVMHPAMETMMSTADDVLEAGGLVGEVRLEIEE